MNNYPIRITNVKSFHSSLGERPYISFEGEIESKYYCSLEESCGDFFSTFSELNKKINGGISLSLKIKKVIFNSPATIVIWNDGTKTIVKAQPGDTYDKELGLAMCCTKKLFGNKGNYNDQVKKFLSEA